MSKKLLSMAAAIANGTRKENSHLVTDAADSAMWDKLAADLARTKALHGPKAEIEIPFDP
jgi:hypothetical protein